MKFTNVHIRRQRLKAWLILVIAILILAGAAIVFINARGIVKSKLANIVDMKIAAVSGRIASVDIMDDPPAQFANKDKVGYYFVHDEEQYYIVSFKEAKYDELAKEFADNGNRLTLRGYTETSEAEMIEIAANTINSSLGEQLITMDNYREYLGSVYLEVDNELAHPYYNLVPGRMFFFFALVIIGLFVLFVGVVSVWKNGWVNVSPYISDEELDRRLSSIDTVWFDQIHTFLTDEYLVHCDYTKIRVIRYADIVQAYEFRGINDGNILNYICIIVKTNDGMGYKVSDKSMPGDKALDQIQEVLQRLPEYNPQIVVGYTE